MSGDTLRRPTGGGFTQTVLGIKARKVAAATESPVAARLALASTIGHKIGGIAFLTGGVLVWRDAMRTHAKIMAGPNATDPGHFNEYVAIGLAIVGLYLLFPDEAMGIFALIKPILPWGKKDTAP